MCTAILKEEAKAPKRAIKDIIVYKIGVKRYEDLFVSPYQFTVYRPNKLARAAMRFTTDVGFADSTEHNYILCNGGYDGFAYVREGFHSFISIGRAKTHINNDTHYFIGEFIIPKGAKYYENACGNIVSNQIIFKQFI